MDAPSGKEIVSELLNELEKFPVKPTHLGDGASDTGNDLSLFINNFTSGTESGYIVREVGNLGGGDINVIHLHQESIYCWKRLLLQTVSKFFKAFENRIKFF